jgi:hypothetical protein
MALTEGWLLSSDLLLFLFADDQDAHSCGRNLQRMLATFQHLLCKKTLDQGSMSIYQKYSRLRCLLHVKGLVICFYLG